MTAISALGSKERLTPAVIGDIYGLYREVIAYWQAVLPEGKIIDVHFVQVNVFVFQGAPRRTIWPSDILLSTASIEIAAR